MISILYPTSDGLVNDVKVIERNQKLVKSLNNEILHKIKEYNESENGFCIKIVEYLIDRNNCFKKIKPLEHDLIKKIKEAYGINNQNDNVGELDISNEIKNFNKVLKHAYINLLFKTHTRFIDLISQEINEINKKIVKKLNNMEHHNKLLFQNYKNYLSDGTNCPNQTIIGEAVKENIILLRDKIIVDKAKPILKVIFKVIFLIYENKKYGKKNSSKISKEYSEAFLNNCNDDLIKDYFISFLIFANRTKNPKLNRKKRNGDGSNS